MADTEEKRSELDSSQDSAANGDEREWAPIQPEVTRTGRTRDRDVTLIRTRSQNGYGCDDTEGDEADETQQEEEKDPFEVGWEDGENDPLNPRSKKKIMKWLIVIICSFSSFCVTCTSSIYTSTYAQLQRDLGSSTIVSTLGLSLFVIGLGIGPMFLGPLSEFYGRRPIYLVSFTFFLIWLVPSAVAQNIQTMLIARFFDGLSGSAFLSVAGGTVGDLFHKKDLQAPMMIFTAAPFVGPSLGPLLGGFINENVSWRWTFYVLIIWTAAMLASIALFVPETYHPVLLRNKARKLRKETGEERWRAPMEKVRSVNIRISSP